MSTKVYNAYIIDTTMQSPWGLIKDISRRLTPIHDGLARMRIVDLLGILLDDRREELMDELLSELYVNRSRPRIRELERQISPMTAAKGILETLNQDFDHKSVSISSDYDLGLTAMFFHTDILPDSLLMKVNCRHSEYLDVLDSEPTLSEYEYWDNSDRPDHLSRKEWTKRQKVWDAAVGSSGTFLHQGLRWTYPRTQYLFSNLSSDDQFSHLRLIPVAEAKAAQIPAISDEEIRSRAEGMVQMLPDFFKDKSMDEIESDVKQKNIDGRQSILRVIRFLESDAI